MSNKSRYSFNKAEPSCLKEKRIMDNRIFSGGAILDFFSGQSEIKANSGRNKFDRNIGNKNQSEQKDKIREFENYINYKPKKRYSDENKKYSIFNHEKKPPDYETGKLVLGVLIYMCVIYIVYGISNNSFSLITFLQITFIPISLDELFFTEKMDLIIGMPLFVWIGITLIFTEIWSFLPNKLSNTPQGLLLFTLLVLFPLILPWAMWPYKISLKVLWSFVYLQWFVMLIRTMK